MFEAWSVAIRLKLLDGVTGGLMGLSHQLLKTHGDAGKLAHQLERIRTGLMISGGMLAVGGGMFDLLGKTVPAAKEYASELARLNTLGMKNADVAAVVSKAWKTSWDVPTSSVVDNIKAFRELYSAFPRGHEREAMSVLPQVQMVQGLLTSITGKQQEHLGFDIVKAAELRTPGGMTADAISKNIDLMARTMVAMQGTITVADYHGALKMGKTSTAGWDDTFTYSYLPFLMQELKTAHGGGAQAAGTYLETLSRQVHGRVQKSAIPMWEAAGLIKSSDVVKTGTGTYQVKPGAVKGVGDYEKDPFLWVKDTLRPAVDHLAKIKNLSPETIIKSMFSDRNAAFVAFNMYSKGTMYERDRKKIESMNGLSLYNQLLKTDPAMAQLALEKQWKNLLAEIGYVLMPKLIKGAEWLVGVVEKMEKWGRAHPGGLDAAINTFGLLAASLVALGGAKTVAGLIKLGGYLFTLTRGVAGLGAAAEGAAGVGAVLTGVAGGLTLLGAVNFIAITGGLGALLGIAIAIEKWAAQFAFLKPEEQPRSRQINANTADRTANSPHMQPFHNGGRWDQLAAQADAREAAKKKAGNAANGKGFWQNHFDRQKTLWASLDVPDPGRVAFPNAAGGSSVAPSAAKPSQTIQVNSTVTIDGRAVARAVTDHQTRALDAPLTGTGNYDPRATLPTARTPYR